MQELPEKGVRDKQGSGIDTGIKTNIKKQIMVKIKKQDDAPSAVGMFALLMFFGVAGIIVFVSDILSIRDQANRAVAIALAIAFVAALTFFYFYDKSQRELYDELKKKKDKEIRDINKKFTDYSVQVTREIKELEEENVMLRKQLRELGKPIEVGLQN